MTTVDSKGRIVLPQHARERLGITPGTEVEISEEDGRAIVEPEDDPERIIGRMEELLDEASADREPVPYEELDPYAQAHADAIRRQARESADDE